MKASDAVARVLSANNVKFGFELVGGMITHLVDSINELGETKLISLHHEQAAAFAAGGIARATNNQKIGLALGTSGPGATNLVTGVADCWLDNYPCIFITGQVNRNELKGDKKIRQQGFQELDIVNIVKSITKYAIQIDSSEKLVPEIQKAIDIARTGRPGPVLIDIPMDLQRAELPDDIIDYLRNNQSEHNLEEKDNLEEKYDIKLHEKFSILINEISNSRKPLFLIGGGAVNEPSYREWQKAISDLGIPHVASLKGSEKSESTANYYGLIGSYGTRTANYALQHSDLLVVLGSRLDVRQTGANTDDFARSAKVIQIDMDPSQLSNRVVAEINIQSSCQSFFDFFLSHPLKNLPIEEWRNSLDEKWKQDFVDEYLDLSLSPFSVFQILNKAFIDKPVHYVADVGNNQMWAAHSLRLRKNQAIHHSGGLGAMGFAIPTGIGVSYASNVPVVILSGDGGAQLNIQELDIIAREKLPILTIVFNNTSLGMVRNFQELYFEGRNSSTYWNGYSSSFSDIGRAYKIDSYKVDNIEEFSNRLHDYIINPKPLLIELLMKDAKECRPRLAFGNPLDKQFPIKG